MTAVGTLINLMKIPREYTEHYHKAMRYPLSVPGAAMCASCISFGVIFALQASVLQHYEWFMGTCGAIGSCTLAYLATEIPGQYYRKKFMAMAHQCSEHQEASRPHEVCSGRNLDARGYLPA
eukprot:CAMPEP_0198582688 /NCGR_PEP_ID=MMETSP1462-20131121/125818_1 /TAXON_ID=1333877 /ORGANISM="Brandtodinium nutriculum, Strain RCC3387" /LENGTH=121 /DNA_ID=CAMNT_0044314091 /DNA_START=18 /DNA_END=379 /DNA_ORIENTATION=-